MNTKHTQIGKADLPSSDYSSEAELQSLFLAMRAFNVAADAELVLICNAKDDKGANRLEKVCLCV